LLPHLHITGFSSIKVEIVSIFFQADPCWFSWPNIQMWRVPLDGVNADAMKEQAAQQKK